MATTQYIGARYVPLFAEPLDWDSTKTYEALTIVYYAGNSYTSRQAVPKGIDITNEKYWALTGNYNAQIEAYRKEVQAHDGKITQNAKDIAAEVTNRIAGDKTLTTNLNTEVTRAKAAESTLTTNLNSEITRAKAAESTLTTNLNSEITRAKAAESTLTTNLNSEITRAKAAESTLTNTYNSKKHPFVANNENSVNSSGDVDLTNDTLIISGTPFGNYSNATLLYVNANSENNKAHITGATPQEIIKDYQSIDSVALSKMNTLNVNIVYNISNYVTLTSTSATFKKGDYSKLKVGSYLLLKNDASTEYKITDKMALGQITKVNGATFTVAGWYGSSGIVSPNNFSYIVLNPVTKVWADYALVVAAENTTGRFCGYEMGVRNNTESTDDNGGFDCRNEEETSNYAFRARGVTNPFLYGFRGVNCKSLLSGYGTPSNYAYLLESTRTDFPNLTDKYSYTMESTGAQSAIRLANPYTGAAAGRDSLINITTAGQTYDCANLIAKQFYVFVGAVASFTLTKSLGGIFWGANNTDYATSKTFTRASGSQPIVVFAYCTHDRLYIIKAIGCNAI